MKSTPSAWRVSHYFWLFLIVSTFLYVSISEIVAGRVSYTLIIVLVALGIVPVAFRLVSKQKQR